MQRSTTARRLAFGLLFAGLGLAASPAAAKLVHQKVCKPAITTTGKGKTEQIAKAIAANEFKKVVNSAYGTKTFSVASSDYQCHMIRFGWECTLTAVPCVLEKSKATLTPPKDPPNPPVARRPVKLRTPPPAARRPERQRRVQQFAPLVPRRAAPGRRSSSRRR